MATRLALGPIMGTSGHKYVDTLLIYHDENRNVQGQLAEAVAGRIMG
ncbi:MAG: hypothetical protein ACLQT6_06290 [Desulfomonilaceae bacterium]